MNKNEVNISASLMCADLYNMKKEFRLLNEANIKLIHYDMMDGNFVPNLGLSMTLLENIKNYKDDLIIEAHLMVNSPQNFISTIAKNKADYIIIHAESTNNLFRVSDLIKSYNCKVGIAINPNTSLSEIEYILNRVSLVLIMTVEPGYAGQEFIQEMIPKIEKLKNIINKNDYDTLIEVDGNINIETIPKVVNAGADILVGGSSGLFRKDVSIKEAAYQMRNCYK